MGKLLVIQVTEGAKCSSLPYIGRLNDDNDGFRFHLSIDSRINTQSFPASTCPGGSKT